MLYKMTLYKKLTISSISATLGMMAVLLSSPPVLANQQLMTEVDAQVALLHRVGAQGDELGREHRLQPLDAGRKVGAHGRGSGALVRGGGGAVRSARRGGEAAA